MQKKEGSFYLGSDSEKTWFELFVLRKRIAAMLAWMPENENWQNLYPDTELRMELADYLKLLYKIFTTDNNHTFLNMNSKI